MSHDILPSAIAALTREADRISQALERVPDAGARRDALLARAAALAKLIGDMSEKTSVAAMREAASELDRIGRRLSANPQNADEGAELLSIAQALVAAENDVVAGGADTAEAEVVTVEEAPVSEALVSDVPVTDDHVPEASVEDAAEGTAEPAEEVPSEASGETSAETAVEAPEAAPEVVLEVVPEAEGKAQHPELQEAAPEEPTAEPLSKPEPMDVKMTLITEIEAATELPEETVEEQAGKKSDEALAGAWMAQNMPRMNKVARNRYGDGKEVCLVANRTAGRDQRNVIAQLPAEALDWARSARRPVKLVLFIRPEDAVAGASMRVVTANLTTAVALATPAKGAKATVSLWDEFGDVEKASGVMASEGSAESPLTEIQVTTAAI